MPTGRAGSPRWVLLQATHPQGAVLTVLRTQKAYRDRLRTACPRCALRFWRLAALRRKYASRPGPDAFLFCRVGGKPVRHAGVPGWQARRADSGRRAAFVYPWPSRPVPGLPCREVA